MEEDQRKKGWHMLAMDSGITTSKGNWYHITEEGINRYVPGLLKVVSLEKIVRTSDIWLDSVNGLSLLLYFGIALFGIDPILSAVISLIFYLIAYFNTSTISVLFLTPVIKYLNMDGVLYLCSGAAMIYFASIDMFTAMGIGILLLFLYKVRLLGLMLEWVLAKSKKGGISRPDRVLNMILVRYGIREGTMTGSVKQMQNDLLEVANYHKTRKKREN